MNPLPLPVRVAAGLLATAVEQARKLPEQLSELPVTAASRAIQSGMRVQQRVTELAVRGDELLSLLRPVEDTPSWARFDEDDEPTDPSGDAPDGLATVVPGPGARQHGEADEAMIARALTPEHPPEDMADITDIAAVRDAGDAERDSSRNGVRAPATSPAALPEYDELTLPQLRGKLRSLTLPQLEALLEHENATRARPPFVTMLSNRIVTVRSQ